MRSLPARPSREHLRKQAKRLARERSLELAAAQRALAGEYGFRTWAAMMRSVDDVRGDVPADKPLFAAVRAGDVDAVRQLIAEGANPRLDDGRETPLHAAARRGPLELVEALIEGGAFTWQVDRAGRLPLDVARRGRARDRSDIVQLLDPSYVADPSFRAAVDAIHSGDVAELAKLLSAEPRLLRERIAGPDVYRKVRRHQYFLDPMLFWYVANNPTLVEQMPPNIVDVARVLIDRGVEQSDLDYTLGLVMSSSAAREQGHQLPLMRVLLAAGAQATADNVVVAAAHHELEPLHALLDAGRPMTAPIAAALGAGEQLRTLLPAADREDIQAAFGLAVINGQLEAARLALDAGADVDAFLPVHAHSTALHEAAVENNVPLIALLLAHGARRDQRDTLWNGTPLDWAAHFNRVEAQGALSEP